MYSILKQIRSFVLNDHSKCSRRQRKQVEICAALEQLEARQLLTVSFETLADFGTATVQSSTPDHFVFGDTLAYFTARTIATGSEIWRTDGTNAGTFLLRDIVPGPESRVGVYPNMLTVVGDTAFFRVTSPHGGDAKLWKSDGTSAGTQIVSMSDGSDVVQPDSITGGDGFVYFTAIDNSGRNLYRLSSAAGAVPVRIEITDSFELPFPGNVGVSTSTATYFAAPYSIAPSTSGIRLLKARPDSDVTETLGLFREMFPWKAIGNRLIFSALRHSDETQSPDKWWITDGTVAGTHKLNLPVSVVPETLVLADDGSIMFMATGSASEWQVWKTDGSENGALQQFAVGNGTGGFSLLFKTATSDGLIFFEAGSGAGAGKIWQTDGTQVGTFALAASADVTIRDLKGSFGNGVVFEGFTFPNPLGLYFVDSSLTEPLDLVSGSGVTNVLASAFIGIGPQMILGDLFSSDTGGGLGIANATSPFTLVKEIAFGTQSSFPGRFVVTDNDVIFNDLSGLAKTNGTASGTVLLNQPTKNFVALPNGWLFAENGQSQAGVLLTRAPGASEWKQFEDVAPRAGAFHTKFLATVGNQLYYLAGLTATSTSLWVTDGTAAGTHAILDGLQSIRDVTAAASFGEHALLFERSPFGHNRELWITDGTEGGTRRLLNLGAPHFVGHGSSTSFHTLGDQVLVFDPIGISVLTDGTVAGSVKLEGLPTGFVKWFGEAGGFQYFGILSNTAAVEFWRTDGTVAGTQLSRVIKDHLVIRESQPADGFADGVTAGGLVYFVARDLKGKADLWVSDGSSSGTRILKTNLISRIDSDGANDLKLYSEFGRLFFVATDETHGRRLWTSDGTELGTELLVTATGDAPPYMDIATYIYATSGSALVSFRGALYYGGITDEFGMEPVKLTSDTIDLAPEPVLTQTGNVPTLHWTELFGAESYDIQLIRLNSSEKTTVNVTGDHWTLPTLAAEGVYRIWIRGLRSDGTVGPWNPEPFDFTLGSRPIIHSSPVLTEDRTPTIFWASPAGTNSSEVWINDLESKQRVSYSFEAGPRSHFDSPQLSPSRYAAWVRTLGDYGASEWSQAAVFTVLTASPQNLSVEVSAQRVMTIRWSPVEGATDYEVYVRGSQSPIPLLSRFQIGPVTSYQLSTPVPGDLYSISVRARRPGRPSSAWTPVLTSFVQEAPKAVLSFPNIRWAAIGQAIGYDLKIIDPRTGKEVVGTNLTSPAYRLDLNPGQYELQLRTLYRDGGASSWASTPFEIFHPTVTILPVSQPTVDATPVIFWNGQAGADSYEFYVQRVGQTTAAYRSTELKETSHRVAVPLAQGNYYVWIRSHYPGGSRSSWGAGTALRIGPPPVVSVSNRTVSWAPVNGATNYDIIIQVAQGLTGSYVDYLRVKDDVVNTVSLSTAPPGLYRVWVRAKRYEAGDVYVSEWSSLLRFELT